MKKITFYSLAAVASMLLAVNANAQGFGTTPTYWTMPNGGYKTGSHNYGFNAIGDAGTSTAGDQGWTVLDINGDGRQDLVVFGEGTGAYYDCPGMPGNPYWKVYLNNGTGFATNYVTWTVPNGGYVTGSHNYGFNAIADAGTYNAGDQGWSVMDIDGDGKPDLVVVGEGTGAYYDCPGMPGNPYWKVYLNNGSGFATNYAVWPVPNGGYVTGSHNYGFNAIADAGTYTAGDQGWSVMDMDADGKPDLVVVGEGTGAYYDCPGMPGNPYWKVYLNNGSGFATNYAVWPVPNGGYVTGSHNYGFNAIADAGTYTAGDQGWATMDMNNDSKPDLVVVGEGTGSYYDCPGMPGNPHWKVYLNTGTGFSGSITYWTLPTGGYVTGSHNYGFNAIGDAGTYTAGDQGWSVLDINGDGTLDLVVVAEGTGSYYDCLGMPGNPHWKAYLNAGTGFSGTPTYWTLPSGGYTTGSHNYGFNAIADAGTYTSGDQGWSVMDLDGDKKADLIIVGEGTGSYYDCPGMPGNPYWKVFNNLSTVAVKEILKSENTLTIYPNPASDHIVISSQDNQVNYTISDNLGKVVLSGNIANGEGSVNIHALTPGIYFVKTNDGTVKKIVKQ